MVEITQTEPQNSSDATNDSTRSSCPAGTHDGGAQGIRRFPATIGRLFPFGRIAFPNTDLASVSSGQNQRVLRPKMDTIMDTKRGMKAGGLLLRTLRALLNDGV